MGVISIKMLSCLTPYVLFVIEQALNHHHRILLSYYFLKHVTNISCVTTNHIVFLYQDQAI